MRLVRRQPLKKLLPVSRQRVSSGCRRAMEATAPSAAVVWAIHSVVSGGAFAVCRHTGSAFAYAPVTLVRSCRHFMPALRDRVLLRAIPDCVFPRASLVMALNQPATGAIRQTSLTCANPPAEMPDIHRLAPPRDDIVPGFQMSSSRVMWSRRVLAILERTSGASVPLRRHAAAHLLAIDLLTTLAIADGEPAGAGQPLLKNPLPADTAD